MHKEEKYKQGTIIFFKVNVISYKMASGRFEISLQELSHDSIARLNCALPITKTISVIR